MPSSAGNVSDVHRIAWMICFAVVDDYILLVPTLSVWPGHVADLFDDLVRQPINVFRCKVWLKMLNTFTYFPPLFSLYTSSTGCQKFTSECVAVGLPSVASESHIAGPNGPIKLRSWSRKKMKNEKERKKERQGAISRWSILICQHLASMVENDRWLKYDKIPLVISGSCSEV